MRPLLDEEVRAGDGLAADGVAASRNAWALRLLEAGDHYQIDPVQRQRVWLRLSRGPARRGMPIRRLALATSIALGMVGGTAIAGAALGRWPDWAVRAYERLTPWSTPSAPQPVGMHTPAPARTHRGAHRAQSQLASAALAQQQQDVGEAPVVDSPAPIPAPTPRAVAATTGSLSAGGVEATRDSSSRRESLVAARGPRHLSQVSANEDDRPVLAAIRALRRDKNPVRARTLLRKYLTDHPNGTLAEEALALSIEAAAAHGDTDAKVLAGRYLQIYPTGPFRSLAEQTLTVRQ